MTNRSQCPVTSTCTWTPPPSPPWVLSVPPAPPSPCTQPHLVTRSHHSGDSSSRPAVLRYFLEYQWFVDFAVYATAVYIFTEGYSCVVEPQREMNLGVLWCLLTVFFSMYPCAVCCHVLLFLPRAPFPFFFLH